MIVNQFIVTNTLFFTFTVYIKVIYTEFHRVILKKSPQNITNTTVKS